MKKFSLILVALSIALCNIAGAQNINTIAGNHFTGYTGDGGPAPLAQMRHPYGVATDCNGNTYIADYENNAIRKIDPFGIISTFAGATGFGYRGDGGQARFALLNRPIAVATDNAGNVYITDQNNFAIRKVNAAGVISTVAGTGINGYTGDGGPATNARISYAVGIKTDAAGNLYIADYLNSAIRKVNPAGIITTIAGTGASGNTGNGGPATAARINNPRDVAADAAGNVYITDYDNHCIRKVNTAGIISRFAGNDTAGYTGNGGPATAARLNFPYGITTDAAGNVYFAELRNHVVRKVNTAGIISVVAGTGANGYSGDGHPADSAQLDQPMSIAFNCAGNLFIADNANQVIRALGDIDRLPFFVGGTTQNFSVCHNSGAVDCGNLLRAIDYDTAQTLTWSVMATPAHGVLSASYTAASTGSTITPTGLSYTPTVGYAGPDAFTVQISDGIASTTTVVNVTVDTAAPTVGAISGLTMVARGANINLYNSVAAGTWTSRNTGIATIDATTGLLNGVAIGTTTITYTVVNGCGTVAATTNIAVVGSIPTPTISTFAGNGTSGYSGDGGLAPSARLNKPAAVAADGSRNVYIIDNNNNVVRKVDASGVITTFAGSGSGGFSGDGSAATIARFNGISGIATDAAGNVYIADAGNRRIRKVNTAGIISTVAGNGTVGIGGNGGPATNATLSLPSQIAVDAAGNLYIADANGDVVRKVNAAGIISTIAGTGASAYSGDGGPASAAQFGAPWGVAADGAGNVYIADHYFNVIRKINTSGIISTYAGTGSWGFSGDGGAATAASMRNPDAIVIDAAGNLFIAEEGNSVIRKVDASGIMSTYAGMAPTNSYTGDGGPANAATLNHPTGVAIDGTGIMYIADYDNYVVRAVGGVNFSPSFTAGGAQSMTICQNAAATSINSRLAIGDADAGQTETWTVTTAPAHGTLSGFSFAATSTGGVVTPSGMTYIPTTGYSGSDVFTIQVSDGTATATTTVSVTVLSLPTITGSNNLCAGQTTTLTGTGSGTWTSSNGNATVGISTGLVTGITSGASVITYRQSTGCAATTGFTVNITPSAISGAGALCVNSTATLGNTNTGGLWTSATPGVASIGSTTGFVTANAAGTATISYTLPTGCATGVVISVNPLPGVISGASSVCVGQNITLTNTVTGGIWSSNNPTNAAIGSTTGIITGVSSGAATMTYTLGTGCFVTASVTVNALAPITGTGVLCEGGTLTLNNTVTGGIWTSSDGSVATVGSSSGIVSAVAPGNAVISYTLPTGCVTTRTVTTNPLAAITGPSSVCVGQTISLANATPGGAWQSGNGTIATIGSASGIVTGITGGTLNVSYLLSTGCTAVQPITVNLLSAISGPTSVCQGQTITLTNATGGGTWSSADGAIATVGSTSGVVTGITTGTVTISYTTAAGCVGVASISVVPSSPITGAGSVCVGQTVTLSSATPGGIWSSSSAIASVNSATGVVTGVAGGSANISYTLGSGCIVTAPITVNSLAPISGASMVCQGQTTAMTNALSGVWSSDNSAIADIGSGTGVVSGIAPGTATISFTTAAGCIATSAISVSPTAAITGASSVCMGQTTTLANGVAGGAWTSSNNTVATVGSASGIVTGIAGGGATISYTTAAGCVITAAITVNTSSSITGASSVCAGQTTALSNAIGGGAWSSSDGSIATVGSASGVVTGISAGAATISYTTASGCVTTAAITVNATAAITGASSVCMGQTITLANSVAGGIWSSSNNTVATIGSTSGIVTGIAGGGATISYTTAAGCVITAAITVNTSSSITGATSVCAGQTTGLSNAIGGGVWSSSDGSIATVGSASGVVTGISAGAATISYTTASGCVTSAAISVNATAAITGASSVCMGQTITLANSVAGGIWSSSNSTVASVGSASGIVTGIAGGGATISYTTAAGCVITTPVTVNTSSSITGATSVCAGQTASVTNAIGGGVWVSSDPAIATIGSASGSVTGITGGIVTFTYTNPSGCVATSSFSVFNSGTISGAGTVCVSQTITLASTVSGGVWSSSNNTIATVGSSTGVVTGMAGGGATISYTVSGCASTASVGVTAIGAITGLTAVCTGNAIALNNATGGGVWTSSNGAVATVGSSTGSVSGIAAGTATISYSVTGCVATTNITVNAISAIGGPASVCAGQTITLTNGATGGVWTSSNPTVAFIGSATGVVTGVAGGSVTVSYTLGSGCIVTAAITVNAQAAITGGTGVCTGQNLNLSNAVGGGAWSSSDPSIAAVGSGTGQVTGIAGGTATISYALPSGCVSTIVITVSALGTISGPTRVCSGQSVTLSNSIGGGVWTSGNNTIATIGSATGVVTGGSAGSVLISYTLGGGCRATYNFTVATLSAIGGLSSVCGGQSITLTDATAGGTWSSSDISVATIGSTNGVVIGANGGGTATITYSLGTGCTVTKSLTVNAFAPITGFPSVCVGQTITMADAQPGGTWSSSAPTIGTITPATGILTGRSTGITVVSYTLGSCRATTTINVSVLGAISGTLRTCVAQNTNLSNTGLGGSWSTSDVSIATVVANTGAVTGVSAGTVVISYAIGTSCLATAVLTVNPLSATTGPNAVCVGQTITLNNTTTGGGLWTSGNTTIAQIGSTTGIVNGVTGGTVSISFTAAGTGCRTTYGITVNLLSPITGVPSVCQGSTTSLTEVGSGIWSSSDPTIATVGSTTAAVTGVSAGTATISFVVNLTGCTATTTFTVYPFAATAGPSSVCTSTPITLTNSIPGGTWTATNSNIARVGSTTGIVTGVAPGLSTNITYNMPSGCKAVKSVAVAACRESEDMQDEVAAATFMLIPNPNNGQFTLKGRFVTTQEETATIDVTDMLGQVVFKTTATAPNGRLNEQIKLPGQLANGMYIVNLHSAGTNKVFHIVVEK